jgi:hypothetical protein
MSGDEPILTDREERAATALRATLHDIAAAEPFRVDREAFTAPVARKGTVRGRLPVGLAAALAVVLVAAMAVFAAPRLGIGGPAAPQEHFDNGQFAFDYPATWQTLGIRSDGGLPVFGTGSWRLGCQGDPSATGCGEEITDVSGGRIVVTMWVNSGAPAACVKNDALGAAPLGDAWIRNAAEDRVFYPAGPTTWEIRRPGYDFGMNGNLWIQAVTDNPAELANAKAMVATFHWEAAGDYCHSPTAAPTLPGTAGHFDNGQLSFDYPTGWRVLAGDYYEGMAVVQVYAVLGTGSWQSGCRSSANGGGCTGDTVDVSSGRVVVKIWSRVDGPVNACMGNDHATATFGPNAVIGSTYGSAVDWQIRYPGAEFQWEGNIDVAVWSDGPAGLAQAQALIASFRWAAGLPSAAGNCAQIDTPAPPTVGPGPT